MNRRIILNATLSLLMFPVVFYAQPGFAQNFSSKPVTLVVPFAPGGNLDVVARTLAPSLERALGRTVIVENRAGAGGAIGATYVARAEADGNTLLVSTPNALVVLPRMTKVTYTLASFQPIGLVATTALVVVVKDQSKFKDMAALMAYARANPGKVTAGHSGLGTTNNIALLQLEEAAKVKFILVAYKGSGPALLDLMGGQIDFVVDQLTSSGTQINAKKLQAVAVMSADRAPTLADVPTLRESGLSNFEATTTTGLLAPAGTPAATIDLINAALHKALNEPAIKSRMLFLGSPGRTSSTQEWAQILKEENIIAQALESAGKLNTN